MQRHLEGGDVALVYVAKFREYGIRILDGGTAYQLIQFCPWCGTALPMPLRDAWFDLLEMAGLEPNSSELPAEFLSEAWWRSRGL